MSLLLLRIMLGMGIIGHALNMYCDRILCIFPTGTINFSNIKEITEGDAAAKLMESTSEKIPMRSAVWGAFAIVLEFFGYSALGIYTYGYSKIYGSVMLAATAFFCITAAAYPVKTALAEYAFLNLGRNADGKKMMLDLLNTAPVLRVCALGLVVVLAVYVIVDRVPHLGTDFYDPSHCHCNVPVSNHRNASHCSYGIHAGLDAVIVG